MSGNFWTAFGVRFGNSASGIDDLLEKDDMTLEELLDHEDVIQDCKYMNANLIEYLSQPNTTLKLVRYVVSRPPESWEEQQAANKYPYVASELFMCEVQSMLDTLFAQEKILDTLFSLLDQKAPLAPGSVAYFRKVVNVCIDRKFEEVLKYAVDHKIITKLISHIGLESIKELLIKLCWGDAANNNFEEISLWLYNDAFVPKLVSRLDPTFENEPDVHANAALTLVDLIFKLEESPQSVLMSHIKSPIILNRMFDYMLSGSASCLDHILGIFIVLVRQHLAFCAQQSPEEDDLDWHDTNAVLDGLTRRLPALVALLDNAPDHGELSLPSGPLPHGTLGPIRLHLLELFDHLLRANDTAINDALVKLGFFSKTVNLFFTFENNNMLHGRVDAIIRFVIDSNDASLQEALFAKTDLMKHILNSGAANEAQIKAYNGHRLGYMGHITRISNVLIMAVKDQQRLAKLICTDEWMAYVEGSLAEENKKQAHVLGGQRPMTESCDQDPDANSSDDDDVCDPGFESGNQQFDSMEFGASDVFGDNSSSDEDDYGIGSSHQAPQYSSSDSSSDEEYPANSVASGVVDLANDSDSDDSDSDEISSTINNFEQAPIDPFEAAEFNEKVSFDDPFSNAVDDPFSPGEDGDAFGDVPPLPPPDAEAFGAISIEAAPLPPPDFSSPLPPPDLDSHLHPPDLNNHLPDPEFDFQAEFSDSD